MADRTNDSSPSDPTQNQRRASGGDDEQALERSLERKTEDLAGDIEENRNLTGSTTYETLSEQRDLDVEERAPDQTRNRNRS